MKEFADDISKCDEIEQYSSERAENLVGKGKIARLQQSSQMALLFGKGLKGKWLLLLRNLSTCHNSVWQVS